MTRKGVFRRSPNEGFTLLEIVVAMAVLAVALASLLSTFNATLYRVGQNAQLTQAVSLAREEMERYRLEILGTTPAPLEDFSESPAGGLDEMKSREEYPDLKFTRKMEPTAIPGAYELIIGVYKEGGEEPRQVYELRQYVAREYGAASGA